MNDTLCAAFLPEVISCVPLIYLSPSVFLRSVAPSPHTKFGWQYYRPLVRMLVSWCPQMIYISNVKLSVLQ